MVFAVSLYNKYIEIILFQDYKLGRDIEPCFKEKNIFYLADQLRSIF